MTVPSVLLGLLAALLLLPSFVLGVQVLAALLPAKRFKGTAEAFNIPPDICLLMPAHNEATGIAKVLQALLPQLNARSRLLVVADNCTDTTAAIVRGFGKICEFIAVVERHNVQFRGKGYALDHGVRQMAINPPEVVVVVDADCELSPNTINALAQLCVASNRPVQALYLMRSPKEAGIELRLAEFAWLVKNQVRALGFQRLGLPCQLMGTGMAFTWHQISRANLRTGHIVEDMQLGVDLALAGTPPLFCPDALVTSEFPGTAEGLASQRTRWEHGHLGVIVAQTPLLLWRSIRSCNGALFAMALDLCVPPLALLTLLIGVTCATSLVLALVGGSVVPSLLSATACVVVGMAVMGAWYGFGRGVISLWQLCKVPLYVLKKVPIYFYFLIKRQSSWVRSKRDGEQ